MSSPQSFDAEASPRFAHRSRFSYGVALALIFLLAGSCKPRSSYRVGRTLLGPEPVTVLTLGDAGWWKERVEGSWKVDIGQDVRTALLAPPGLQRPIEVGPTSKSRLRFAMALFGNVPPPVTFRVKSAPDGGILFEEKIESAGGWIEREIALPDEPSMLLTLETAATEDLDLDRGVPVWGSLEVEESVVGERPPDIVLVSADTLRADHMSAYGYRKRTTPRLEQWASENGVIFQDMVAASPWTLPSHASLLTGLDPLTHDVNYEEAVGASWTTLAEHLQEAGYDTIAVTGGGYLAPQYGFTQGFDRYLYWVQPKGELQWGAERVEKILGQSADRPLFVFFHTYEVHSPYRVREPYFQAFSEGEVVRPGGLSLLEHSYPLDRSETYKTLKWFVWGDANEKPTEELLEVDSLFELKARYDSSVAYLDEKLGELLDVVEESGRSTAFVLTSDHGEALGEKGLGSHASLYEFNLRIPFIASFPGLEVPRTLSRQVRQIDIAPSLLDLVGIEANEMEGSSVLPLLEDANAPFPDEAWSVAASSNYGISLRKAGRSKYIFTDTIWPTPDDRDELYDLPRDPLETNDLRSLDAEVTERFRDRVTQRLTGRGQGLLVALSNPTGEPVQGTLSGAAFRLNKFKTWGPTHGWVRWDSRTLTFELEPAIEVGLLLMDPPTENDIRVRLSRRDGTFVDRSLSPREMDREWVVEAEEGGASVRFRWTERPPETSEGLEIPSSLEEQLRALGYLDQ